MQIDEYLEGKGVRIRRKSRAPHMCLCPLPGHNEDTPSFAIYDGNFHCYGCDEGGDIVRLVRLLEFDHLADDKKAYHEAYKFVERANGGPLTPVEKAVKKPVERKLTDEEIMLLDIVGAVYHECLRETPQAVEYLVSRGIPEDVILLKRTLPDVNIYFGYCPADGSAYPRLIAELGRLFGRMPFEMLTDLGIITEKRWERFSGRIVIPEWRDKGPIWMHGRSLDKDAQPKYLGLPIPKPLCFAPLLIKPKRTDRVWLCEGYFDAVVLVLAGEVAVSMGSAALKDEVIPYLAPFDEVIVAVDEDQDGFDMRNPNKDALIKIPEKLRKAGVRNISVPDFPRGINDINALATHLLYGVEYLFERPRRKVEPAMVLLGRMA